MMTNLLPLFPSTTARAKVCVPGRHALWRENSGAELGCVEMRTQLGSSRQRLRGVR
jgi:hypothetical protein